MQLFLTALLAAPVAVPMPTTHAPAAIQPQDGARDALERPPLLRHHLAHLRLGLLPAGLVPSEPGLYPPRRVVLRLLLRLPPLLPSLGEVIANVWFERVVVVRVGEVLAPRRRVQRGERLGHDGGAAEAAIGVVAAL